MASNIDERIVQMTFNNEQFEKGAAETIKTLAELKKAMEMEKAAKSLDAMQQTISEFNFDPINDSIEELNDKIDSIGETVGGLEERFSAFGTFAAKIVENFATTAYQKLSGVFNDLTFSNIGGGFDKYATQTKAIQTITNATGKSVAEVEVVLEKLAHYTDETSYDFSTMVETIGKFTSVGVELERAETAMEGIGNEAAKSGAGIQEANRAMYNFAQALSAGHVKLQDWKSIENANMATKEFKETLIQTAIELGTLEKKGENIGALVTNNEKKIQKAHERVEKAEKNAEKRIEKARRATYKDSAKRSAKLKEVKRDAQDAVKEAKEAEKKAIAESRKELIVDYKNFNETLKEEWLTSDVLITALEKYTDMNTELGRSSYEAAQKALTFGDAINAIKDAVSSGWMTSFKYMFGDLDEAIDLWTRFCNAIIDFLSFFSETRNEILKGWHDLGGYNSAVEAASNLWHAFTGIIDRVKDALSNILPPLDQVIQGFVDATKRFEGFTKKLRDIFGLEEPEEAEAIKETTKAVEDKTEAKEEEAKAQKMNNSESEKTVKILDQQIKKSQYLNKALKNGSKGNDVKDLQKQLIREGYLRDKYGADGVYGPNTKAAVKKLQKDLNVKVTGQWDKATRAAYKGRLNSASKLSGAEKRISKEIKSTTKETAKIVSSEKDIVELRKKMAAIAKSEKETQQSKAKNKQLQKEIKNIKTLSSTIPIETKAIKETTSELEKQTKFSKASNTNSIKNTERGTKRRKKTIAELQAINEGLDKKAKLENKNTKAAPDLLSSNYNVKDLQKQLIHEGYLKDKYGADGIYGPNTREAVKALQKDLNVKVTGQWDKATRSAYRGRLNSASNLVKTESSVTKQTKATVEQDRKKITNEKTINTLKKENAKLENNGSTEKTASDSIKAINKQISSVQTLSSTMAIESKEIEKTNDQTKKQIQETKTLTNVNNQNNKGRKKTVDELRAINEELRKKAVLENESTKNNKKQSFSKDMNSKMDSDLLSDNYNVKDLQKQLIHDGYLKDKYGADGIYGPNTKAAVKALQKDLNVAITGQWDKETRAAYKNRLNGQKKVNKTVHSEEVSNKKINKQTEQKLKNLKKEIGLNEELNKTLKSGDRGSSVKELQKGLLNLGYLKGGIDAADGIYGPKTQEAIKKLQSNLGLAITGAWDEATIKAMKASEFVGKIDSDADKVRKKMEEIYKKSNEDKYERKWSGKNGELSYELIPKGTGDKTEKEAKQIKKAASTVDQSIVALRRSVKEEKKAQYTDYLRPGGQKILATQSEFMNSEEVRYLQGDKKREAFLKKKNEEVKKLQTALIETGYLTDKTIADGIYGPETVAAVKKLQRELGVKDSGNWNAETRSAVDLRGKFIKKTGEEVNEVFHAEVIQSRLAVITEGVASAVDIIRKVLGGAKRLFAGFASMFAPLLDPIGRFASIIALMFKNLNKQITSSKVNKFVDVLLKKLKPLKDAIKFVSEALHGFVNGYLRFVQGTNKTLDTSKITFESFFKYLGMQLSKFVNKIANFLLDNPVTRFFKNMFSSVANLLKSNPITKPIGDFLEGIINGFGDFSKQISGFSLAGKIKYIFYTLRQAVLDNPVGKALVDFFTSVSSALSTFNKETSGLSFESKILYAFLTLKEEIQKIPIVKTITDLFENIKTKWEQFTTWLEGISSSISDKISKVKEAYDAEGLSGALKSLSDVFAPLVEKWEAFKSRIMDIFGTIPALFEEIKSAFDQNGINGVVELFKEKIADLKPEDLLPVGLAGLGTAIVGFILKKIIGGFGKSGNTFQGGMKKGLAGLILPALSSVAAYILSDVGAGDTFAGVATTYFGGPIAYALTTLGSMILNAFSPETRQAIHDFFSTFAESVKNNGFIQTVGDTIPKVIEFFSNAWKNFTSLFSGENGKTLTEIIDEWIGNFKNSAFYKNLKEVFPNLLKFFENTWESFKKWFAENIQGKNIFELIGRGISTVISGIYSALLKMVSGAAKGIQDTLLPQIQKTLGDLLNLVGDAISSIVNTKGFWPKAIGGLLLYIMAQAGTIIKIVDKFATAKVLKEGGKVDTFGTTILKIGGSIALLIAAFAGLIWAFSKWDDIKNPELILYGFVGIIVLLGAVVGAIAGIKILTKQFDSKAGNDIGSQLLQMASSIAAIGVGIILFGVALKWLFQKVETVTEIDENGKKVEKKVKKFDGNALGDAIGLITLFLIELVGAQMALIWASGKWSDGKSKIAINGILEASKGLVAIAIAMSIVAASINLFGSNTLWQATAMISIMLVLLGGIFVAITVAAKKIEGSEGKIKIALKGIIGLGIGVNLIAISIGTMAGIISSNDLATNISAIGTILVLIAGLLVGLNFLARAEKKALDFIAIGGMFILIGTTISGIAIALGHASVLVKDVPIEKLATFIIGIAVISGVITKAAPEIAKGNTQWKQLLSNLIPLAGITIAVIGIGYALAHAISLIQGNFDYVLIGEYLAGIVFITKSVGDVAIALAKQSSNFESAKGVIKTFVGMAFGVAIIAGAVAYSIRLIKGYGQLLLTGAYLNAIVDICEIIGEVAVKLIKEKPEVEQGKAVTRIFVGMAAGIALMAVGIGYALRVIKGTDIIQGFVFLGAIKSIVELLGETATDLITDQNKPDMEQAKAIALAYGAMAAAIGVMAIGIGFGMSLIKNNYDPLNSFIYFAGLAGITYILGKVAIELMKNNSTVAQGGSIALSYGVMAVAIGGMAIGIGYAMSLMKDINWEQALTFMGGIAGIAAIMGMAAVEMIKVGPDLYKGGGVALAFVGMGIGIGLVALALGEAIPKIQGVDLGLMSAFLGVFIGIVAAMGVVGYFMTKNATNALGGLGVALAFVGMGFGLKLVADALGDALPKMKDLETGKAAAILGIFCGIILLMGAAAVLMGAMPQAILGGVGACIAFIGMGFGISMIAEALGEAIKKIKDVDQGVIEAFLNNILYIVMALGVIAVVLSAFGIGAIFGAIAAVILIGVLMAAAAQTLGEMGHVLFGLGSSMQDFSSMVSDINYTNVNTIVNSLLETFNLLLTSLSSYVTMAGSAQDTMSKISNIAGQIGNVVSIFNDIGDEFSTKVTNFTSSLSEIDTAITNVKINQTHLDMLNNLSGAITLYFEALKKANSESENAASVDSQVVKEAFTALSDAIDEDVIKQFASYGTGQDNDLNNMATGITNLGTAISSYATDIGGINQTDLQNAKSVIDQVTGLYDTLREGGAFQKLMSFFAGQRTNLSEFSGDMRVLGVAIRDYTILVSSANYDNFDKAKESIEFIAKINNDLPKSGGVFQFFSGKQDLNAFADNMSAMGKGVVNFVNATSEGNYSNIDGALGVITKINEMLMGLENSGGVAGWWSGEKSFEGLTSGLPEVGADLKLFQDNIGNFDYDKFKTILDGTIETFNSINLTNLEYDEGKLFGSRIGAAAAVFKRFKEFLNELATLTNEDLQKQGSSLDSYKTLGQTLFNSICNGILDGANSSEDDSFKKALEKIVNDTSTIAVTTLSEALEKIGKDFAATISGSITSELDGVKSTLGEMSGATNSDSNSDLPGKVSADVSQGVVDGVQNGMEKAASGPYIDPNVNKLGVMGSKALAEAIGDTNNPALQKAKGFFDNIAESGDIRTAGSKQGAEYGIGFLAGASETLLGKDNELTKGLYQLEGNVEKAESVSAGWNKIVDEKGKEMVHSASIATTEFVKENREEIVNAVTQGNEAVGQALVATVDMIATNSDYVENTINTAYKDGFSKAFTNVGVDMAKSAITGALGEEDAIGQALCSMLTDVGNSGDITKVTDYMLSPAGINMVAGMSAAIYGEEDEMTKSLMELFVNVSNSGELGTGIQQTYIPLATKVVRGYTDQLLKEQPEVAAAISDLLTKVGTGASIDVKKDVVPLAKTVTSAVSEGIGDGENDISTALTTVVTNATSKEELKAGLKDLALKTATNFVGQMASESSNDENTSILANGLKILLDKTKESKDLESGLYDASLAIASDIVGQIATSTSSDENTKQLATGVQSLLAKAPNSEELKKSAETYGLALSGMVFAAFAQEGDSENQTNALKDGFTNLLTKATSEDGLPTNFFSGVKALGQKAASNISTSVSGIGSQEELKKNIQQLVSNVSNDEELQNSIKQDASNLGKYIDYGLEEGIKDPVASQRVKNAMINLAKVAFNAAKSELEVNSPSKKAQWLGEMFDEGLANGIEAQSKLVDDAAEAVVSDPVDTIENAMQSATPDTLSQFAETLGRKFESLGDRIEDLRLTLEKVNISKTTEQVQDLGQASKDVDFSGADKQLSGIEKSSSKVDLSSMSDQLTGLDKASSDIDMSSLDKQFSGFGKDLDTDKVASQLSDLSSSFDFKSLLGDNFDLSNLTESGFDLKSILGDNFDLSKLTESGFDIQSLLGENFDLSKLTDGSMFDLKSLIGDKLDIGALIKDKIPDIGGTILGALGLDGLKDKFSGLGDTLGGLINFDSIKDKFSDLGGSLLGSLDFSEIQSSLSSLDFGGAIDSLKSQITSLSGEDLLGGLVDNVKQQFDSISVADLFKPKDGSEPTIVPVIDISNIESNKDAIRQALGIDDFGMTISANNSAALANGIMLETIHADLEEMKQIMRDTQYVNAFFMNRIDDKIEVLNNTVDSLGIYLDSDAIVAGTVEKMDKALGKRAANKTRVGKR